MSRARSGLAGTLYRARAAAGTCRDSAAVEGPTPLPDGVEPEQAGTWQALVAFGGKALTLGHMPRRVRLSPLGSAGRLLG